MAVQRHFRRCAGAAALSAVIGLASPTPGFSWVAWRVIDNAAAHWIRVDFCSGAYQNRCWPSPSMRASSIGQYSMPNCVSGEQVCYRATSPDGTVIGQDCSICGPRPMLLP